jgi:hypothetical protein
VSIRELGIAMLAGLYLSGAAVSRQVKSAPQSPPASAELEYEAFCKKDEKEKRRLFRAAPVDQKAVLARTQMERWLEANRSSLSNEQLAVLQELIPTVTADLFQSNSEAKAKMQSFEARASSVFKGIQLDEMGPSGPCLAKKR